jgi:hypothetical protein
MKKERDMSNETEQRKRVMECAHKLKQAAEHGSHGFQVQWPPTYEIAAVLLAQEAEIAEQRALLERLLRSRVWQGSDPLYLDLIAHLDGSKPREELVKANSAAPSDRREHPPLLPDVMRENAQLRKRIAQLGDQITQLCEDAVARDARIAELTLISQNNTELFRISEPLELERNKETAIYPIQQMADDNAERIEKRDAEIAAAIAEVAHEVDVAKAEWAHQQGQIDALTEAVLAMNAHMD